MENLEDIQLNFSDGGLLVMNISLFFIMFAVALGMNLNDLRDLRTQGKAILSGLLSQWLILPLITLLLIYLLEPHPLFALGMILVSVCPGGNVSNFFTMLANGNVGLSVVLTSFSSFFAAFLTPLGFALWSSLSPAAEYSRSFSLSFTELAITLLLILVLPLILGIMMRLKFERLAAILRVPMKFIGIVVLAGFIGVALWNNRLAFTEHLDKVFLLVLVHNAIVLSGAFFWAKIMRNRLKETTTIMIETGIQNSGLGLVIIFGFFNGNGAMAMIAAWWGVWHLIAGSVVSSILHYQNKSRKIA